MEFAVAADEYRSEATILPRVALLNRAIGVLPQWYGPRMEYALLLEEEGHLALALEEVEKCLFYLEVKRIPGPFGQSVADDDLRVLRDIHARLESANLKITHESEEK